MGEGDTNLTYLNGELYVHYDNVCNLSPIYIVILERTGRIVLKKLEMFNCSRTTMGADQ